MDYNAVKKGEGQLRMNYHTPENAGGAGSSPACGTTSGRGISTTSTASSLFMEQ
jgi:hypothetical protein